MSDELQIVEKIGGDIVKDIVLRPEPVQAIAAKKKAKEPTEPKRGPGRPRREGPPKKRPRKNIIGKPQRPLYNDGFLDTTQGDVSKDSRLIGKFSVGDKVRIRRDITLEDVDNIRGMYALRGKEATVTAIVYGLYVQTDADEYPWIWWPYLLQKKEVQD